MRDLFCKYSNKKTKNNNFVISNNEFWRISFRSNSLNRKTIGLQNHSIHIIRKVRCKEEKEPVFYELFIYIDPLLENIKYVVYKFYNDIPTHLKKIKHLKIEYLGSKKFLIRYDAKTVHENRTFFEKEHILLRIPKKMVGIVDQFLNLDDSFGKMNEIRREKFFCGFFREHSEQLIITDAQNLIKNKVVSLANSTENEESYRTYKLI